MLYVILLLAQYGANLPMVGALTLNAPPEMVPMLADNRLFTTLAAAPVTAAGLALLIASKKLDISLLITSKAVAVVITALPGFVAVHFTYPQLTDSTDFSLKPLTQHYLALPVFLVF